MHRGRMLVEQSHLKYMPSGCHRTHRCKAPQGLVAYQAKQGVKVDLREYYEWRSIEGFESSPKP